MLNLLHEILEKSSAYFEEREIDADIQETGKSAIKEIQKQGFYIQRDIDQKMRPVFVRLQALAERASVDELINQNRLSQQVEAEKEMVNELKNKKGIKSVWIIHTPLIATPCVTNGQATDGLLAKEIEQNEKLKELTLARASIIRDYLKQDGKLIIAYNENENSRTAEQIAIYRSLQEEYPRQILDFPMALDGDSYPEDLIGATYLMQDPEGNYFEMTNRGVQAKQPPNEAAWGIWMQDSQKPVEKVGARMKLIVDFLVEHGMEEKLKEGSVNKEAFSPLNRYMNSELKNKISSP